MYYNFLTRPDLRVIDKAIELIATSEEKYSCWALEKAVRAHYPWDLQDKVFAQYREQYSQLICHSQPKWPWWWNYGRFCIEERVEALTKFKQACIDAREREAQNVQK